jgi:hypothetical protein
MWRWAGSMLLAISAWEQTPAQTTPPGSQIICRPCGETPPPKGYSCTAGAMVADTVPNANIATAVAAACKSDRSSAPSPKSNDGVGKPGTSHTKRRKARSSHHAQCRRRKQDVPRNVGQP